MNRTLLAFKELLNNVNNNNKQIIKKIIKKDKLPRLKNNCARLKSSINSMR